MNRWWAIVDIGNSVAKCGLFDPNADPSSREFKHLSDAPLDDPQRLAKLLALEADLHLEWFVSSVNRPAEQRLRAWIEEFRPTDRYRRLTYEDCPLKIAVDFPEQVGFDRLATSVAADGWRYPGQGAIVVDAGTALKVHAVSAASEFLGGVILPGFRLAAQALQKGTDLLPMVDASLNISPPDVFGRNTQAAIRGGLYWGAVGAVREVVARMRADLGAATPVFVTGGDAQGLGVLIDDDDSRFVPHMCLEGIVRIARGLSGSYRS